MKEESLHEFYEFVILPQFGINGRELEWTGCETIGPDDDAHYFKIKSEAYVLIFRDYGNFTDEEIREVIKLPNDNFEYIKPLSHTDIPPYYPFGPRSPCKHAHNITGTFTLLKI